MPFKEKDANIEQTDKKNKKIEEVSFFDEYGKICAIKCNIVYEQKISTASKYQ